MMTSAAIITPSAGALNLNVPESQINGLETESLVERLENSGKVVAGTVAEGGEQKQEAETQPLENQIANGQLEGSKSVDVSIPVVDGAAGKVDADKTEPVLQSGQPLTDLEKKQRRAERFGVGLNMSEGEKRKIRASRFGGDDKKGTISPKADSSAAAEAERRNLRAARFGISNATAAADDEETKKKARLNRFTGVDSNLEAEKKKARAARFGSENEEGVKKKLRTDTAVTAAQG